MTVVNGVATFSGLTLNKVGTGYTLKVTSGSLTTTTIGFNVTAAAASSLHVQRNARHRHGRYGLQLHGDGL